MKVLVACEFSGIVRDAFLSRGHDAVSCDLLPTERPGPHLQCDVRSVLDSGWDLIIAHPPCTDLASSGARWWAAKGEQRYRDAVAFATCFLGHAPRVAIENPIGRLATAWRKPDQIIQPFQFGDPEWKTTCLWLANLPLLAHDPVQLRPDPKASRVWRQPGGPDRWRERSRSFPGIARAMAEQWGALAVGAGAGAISWEAAR